MSYNFLELTFRDHEATDPDELTGYYEGYDVFLGGDRLLFYPYNGSSWEEAAEDIIGALGELISEHRKWRKPRKEGEW